MLTLSAGNNDIFYLEQNVRLMERNPLTTTNICTNWSLSHHPRITVVARPDYGACLATDWFLSLNMDFTLEMMDKLCALC